MLCLIRRMPAAPAVCALALALVFTMLPCARTSALAAAQADQVVVPVQHAPCALTAALDPVIDKALAENRLTGVVVLVARNGKTVYSRAAGFADREAQKPMREDTIFRLASVSKAYTAMAAAALLEQGKLKLDEPITTWLPEFAPDLPGGGKAVITVRQLLAHTAGLNYSFAEPADGPYHKAGVSDGLDQAGISLDENMRRLASVPLEYAPGTRWRYSLASDVLGAVVAKAAGMPLPEAIEALVIRPLGMKDSGFAVTDPSAQARLATAYYNVFPLNAAQAPQPMKDGEDVSFGGEGAVRFFPSRILDRAAFPSGGAGMAGTAPDVLRLLEAIRTGAAGSGSAGSGAAGSGAAGAQPIVGAAVLQEMHRNQIGSMPMMPGYGFGLGWAVCLDPAAAKSPESPGALNWGGAYGSSWLIDPEHKLSMVVLTNTAPEGMWGPSVQAMREAVYGVLRCLR